MSYKDITCQGQQNLDEVHCQANQDHYGQYGIKLFVCRYIQLPGAGELGQLEDLLQDPDNPAQYDRYRVILYIDGFIVKVQRPDGAGDMPTSAVATGSRVTLLTCST